MQETPSIYLDTPEEFYHVKSFLEQKQEMKDHQRVTTLFNEMYDLIDQFLKKNGTSIKTGDLQRIHVEDLEEIRMKLAQLIRPVRSLQEHGGTAEFYQHFERVLHTVWEIIITMQHTCGAAKEIRSNQEMVMAGFRQQVSFLHDVMGKMQKLPLPKKDLSFWMKRAAKILLPVLALQAAVPESVNSEVTMATQVSTQDSESRTGGNSRHEVETNIEGEMVDQVVAYIDPMNSPTLGNDQLWAQFESRKMSDGKLHITPVERSPDPRATEQGKVNMEPMDMKMGGKVALFSPPGYMVDTLSIMPSGVDFRYDPQYQSIQFLQEVKMVRIEYTVVKAKERREFQPMLVTDRPLHEEEKNLVYQSMHHRFITRNAEELHHDLQNYFFQRSFTYITSSQLDGLVQLLPGSQSLKTSVLRIGDCDTLSEHVCELLSHAGVPNVMAGGIASKERVLNKMNGHGKVFFGFDTHKPYTPFESTQYVKQKFEQIEFLPQHYDMLQRIVARSLDAKTVEEQTAFLQEFQQTLMQILRLDHYQQFNRDGDLFEEFGASVNSRGGKKGKKGGGGSDDTGGGADNSEFVEPDQDAQREADKSLKQEQGKPKEDSYAFLFGFFSMCIAAGVSVLVVRRLLKRIIDKNLNKQQMMVMDIMGRLEETEISLAKVLEPETYIDDILQWLIDDQSVVPSSEKSRILSLPLEKKRAIAIFLTQANTFRSTLTNDLLGEVFATRQMRIILNKLHKKILDQEQVTEFDLVDTLREMAVEQMSDAMTEAQNKNFQLMAQSWLDDGKNLLVSLMSRQKKLSLSEVASAFSIAGLTPTDPDVHSRRLQGGKGYDVRPVSPGEVFDAALVDWNITARTGEYHIKQVPLATSQEKQQQIHIVIDVNGVQVGKLAAFLLYVAMNPQIRVEQIQFVLHGELIKKLGDGTQASIDSGVLKKMYGMKSHLERENFVKYVLARKLQLHLETSVQTLLRFIDDDHWTADSTGWLHKMAPRVQPKKYPIFYFGDREAYLPDGYTDVRSMVSTRKSA